MTDHSQDSSPDGDQQRPSAQGPSAQNPDAASRAHEGTPPAPRLPQPAAGQGSTDGGSIGQNPDRATPPEGSPTAAAAHDFGASPTQYPGHDRTSPQNATAPTGAQHPTGNQYPGSSSGNGYDGTSHFAGNAYPTQADPASAAYGPNGYAPGSHPQPPAPREKRRSNVGLLVAGLAVGALVGGAAGAGTSALIMSNQSGTVSPNATGSENITINDTSDVSLVSAIAAKASPSVVTLSVEGSQSAGSGSGIILSEDGYVLTNNHVVTLDGQLSDPAIQVTSNDGKLYDATVVGTDPAYDLAVIQLEDVSGLTPIEFADSNKLNVGDLAVAIGAPLGLAGSVTDGIISALNRSITVASSAVPEEGSNGDDTEQDPYDVWGFDIPGQTPESAPSEQAVISLSVIQTDAAINPGNSGGALVDAEAKLIGVNVAIATAGSDSSQGGSIGVGFAIPSNVAKRVAEEIIEDGEATHGLLGATVGDAASAEGSPVVGALINEVTPGGAAEEAGLASGDIVTNFNGYPITGATDLTAQVRALAAGDEAEVTYVRNGDTRTATVTLGQLVL